MTTILILAGVFAALTILLSDIGWNNVLSPDRNELVFEGRHRAYGAYPQRKEHHRVMMLSFTLAVGTIGALLLAPRFLVGNEAPPPSKPPIDDERIITIEPLKDLDKRTTTATATPPARNRTPFAPVPIDSVPEAPIDTTPQAPDPVYAGNGPAGPVDTASTGTGAAGGGGGTSLDPNTIREWVPVMPVFPGGDEALQDFWQQNVNWTSDMLPGQSAVVYIEFVVDVNGRVYDARIARSVGAQLDAAVLRAMRRMPDWIPGRMGDEPVKVRMTQPVRFRVR